MRFRLIKPNWARPKLRNGTANPEFIRPVAGPDVFEGTWEDEFLKKRNEEGFHVYYFPNYPKRVPERKPFISGKDIDVFSWVFCDFDVKSGTYESKEAFLDFVSKFPVKPTKAVDSGNGIHVYWKINDLDRDSYIYAQLALIQHFRTDESVWTPLQLMRYPGSFNTKDPGNYKPVTLLQDHGCKKSYSLEELATHLQPLTSENQKKMTEHIDKLEGRKEIDLEGGDIDFTALPERFVKLMDSYKRVKDLFTSPSTSFGERSGADMSLCNKLYEVGFSREESLQVIANSLKAKERSTANRIAYAFGIVDRVFTTRPKNPAESISQIEGSGKVEKSGSMVSGPDYFDCMVRGWRKKEVLGLIAGPGVGKTTVSLNIVDEIISRNSDNDDISVFFSLEMPPGDIIERWNALIGEEKVKSDRLYLVSNRDENGDLIDIGLQEIYQRCKDTVDRTGKKLGAVIIDHVSILHRVVDVTIKPNFGAEGEVSGGTGRRRTLDIKAICKGLKTLARMLDCFLIVQSQTTKVRAAQGDVPLGLEAAYGAADFEWNCDYIMTCWQPLRKVYDQTDMRALAWQYAKIREKKKGDRVVEFRKNMLSFDLDSGKLRVMVGNELATAKEWIAKANELRKAAEKKQEDDYENSPRAAIKLIKAYKAEEESD